MSALENLAAAKAKADSRVNFDRFIESRRTAGWMDVDIAEYRESVRILIGNDDASALALFPARTYPTAEFARQDAREYWKRSAA
jgi:hypothetical protein